MTRVGHRAAGERWRRDAAVERKLGIGKQDQAGQGQQDQGNQGQGGPQDQQDRDQQAG